MPENPLISQIKVGGTTYDIKDAKARDDIDDLKKAISGGVHYIGVTTSELVDGGTTNPITVDSKSYTAVAGDLVSKGNKEFIFDGTTWHEVGDLTGLGDLAWKDEASGTYTPRGTVSQPTFSGTEWTADGTVAVPTSAATTVATTENKTATVAPAGSGEATYTPAGTVGTAEVTIGTITVPNVTQAGTATVVTMAVPANTEVLELSVTPGTDTTLGNSITALTGTPASGETDVTFTTTAPTWTGTGVRLVTDNIAVPATFSTELTDTTKTVSITATPEGTVSQPTFSGTEDTITVS